MTHKLINTITKVLTTTRRVIQELHTTIGRSRLQLSFLHNLDEDEESIYNRSWDYKTGSLLIRWFELVSAGVPKKGMIETKRFGGFWHRWCVRWDDFGFDFVTRMSSSSQERTRCRPASGHPLPGDFSCSCIHLKMKFLLSSSLKILR